MIDYGAYHGPFPDESGAPGCHIFGWMSPGELDWLHQKASGMSNVAEIGCFKGRSTYALLTGCKGLVYACDPWGADTPIYADQPGSAFYPSSLPEFEENVGHFENLVMVAIKSPEAAALVPDVDMCFIDGDHSASGLTADLTAWLPKTRKLICGHDYDHANYPAVTHVTDHWFKDRLSVVPGTGIWWVDL